MKLFVSNGKCVCAPFHCVLRLWNKTVIHHTVIIISFFKTDCGNNSSASSFLHFFKQFYCGVSFVLQYSSLIKAWSTYRLKVY